MSKLDDMAKIETQAYLEHSAQTFCETAISLMATCMSIPAVIAYLERQIEHLKEFG